MRRWPFKVMAGPDERLQVEVRWKGRLWQFTPVEICSMILLQIKENAETSLGDTIVNAVITVPVHFNYEQRLGVRQAGMIAGLNFMQIICSPAASAFLYGLERQSKINYMINLARSLFTSELEEHNIIIFDLGAGTLDVAVVTIKEDVCKVRAAAGDVHLGGSDFDNNLVDYCVNWLRKRGRENISGIPMTRSNLRTWCEKAKMSLCSGGIMVPVTITPPYNDVNLESSITEEKFNELNNDLFLKCIHIMDACLRDARISIDAVHEVILAGNSARIPLVQYYIKKYFRSKEVNISQHLETATAYGAAFQAFFLSRRENARVGCLSLVDVTPFTLGLRLVEVMLACVPKNTNIPVKIEKTFRSNQRQFLVEVYEGEGTMICENNFLGKFELSGTQTSPNWHEINVCFEILENGTLTVMAEEIPSGNKNSITLTNNNIVDSHKLVWEALFYKESVKGVNKASATKSLTTSRTSCKWDQMVDSKILDSLLSFEKESSEKSMGQSTTKSLDASGTSHEFDQVGASKVLDKLLSMEQEGSEKIMGKSSRQNVEPEEYVVGIDFGTTYSCVAVWQQNGVKIIENEYGSHLTCSAVAFTDTGRLIGDTVHKEHVINTIPNIKRLVGRCFSDQSVRSDNNFFPFRVLWGNKNRSLVSVQYNNEEKLFTPEEIAAMILSKMKEIAEEHLNSKVTNAVISVPACFRDSQRKAIKDAGAIAGFNVLQLLNEPTAAAITYFLQEVSCQSSCEKILLIFDLGGGNLDVSIVTINEGTIRVRTVAGDSNLGGEDFDNNMVSHFVEKFMKEKKRDIRNKPRPLRRLRVACEKAKRALSTNPQTVVEIDALDEGIDFRSAITRIAFEELNEGLFKRSIGCVERCLEDAKMDRSCIDEVVLVGGSTRIPKMQQLLQEFFNREDLCKSMDAQEAVVYGAAVQAAILSGNENREKFNILEVQDVTSLSFGIGYEDGATMNLLIPKHTPIPAKKELLITTRSDYLSSLSLQVEECELASTTVFAISDIAPKPRGNSKIIVSFEVDDSGILNVTAKDMNAREKNEIVISKENGGLTPEEIQKMSEAAVRYKVEDEEHKARLAALNSLENFAYRMKAIVRDPGISTTRKKLVEEAAYNAIAWLDTNHCAAIDEISAWQRQLETIKSQIVYLGTDASL